MRKVGYVLIAVLAVQFYYLVSLLRKKQAPHQESVMPIPHPDNIATACLGFSLIILMMFTMLLLIAAVQ